MFIIFNNYPATPTNISTIPMVEHIINYPYFRLLTNDFEVKITEEYNYKVQKERFLGSFQQEFFSCRYFEMRDFLESLWKITPNFVHIFFFPVKSHSVIANTVDNMFGKF